MRFNKKIAFAVVFFFSVAVLAATRVSRFDEFQGGIFTGDSATITTINGTTLNGTTVNGGNLRLTGNSLISTDTDGNINFDPNGAGLSVFSDLTATTVPYLGASKELLSSSVTPTELGYLSGVTSAIQTQIDAKTGTFSGSTDNVVMRSDGTGGATIQESGVSIDDSDVITGITQLNLITQGPLRLQDLSGGEYMAFRAPSTVTSSTTLTLPDGDGSNGQTMITNGSGTLAWGTAGGGGGKNYFTDGTMETATAADNETYHDGATYVNGVGGSVAALTASLNTTTPLEGDQDLKLTKSATDGSGDGLTLASTTIDKFARGRNLWFTAEVDCSDSNYTAGDLKLYAYDVGGAAILPILPVGGLGDDGTIEKASQRIVAYIQTSGDTDGVVRVSAHLGSDSATGSAWSCYLDDVKLAPDAVVPGAIIGQWQDYDIVITGSTTDPTRASSPDVDQAQWRRVGENMEIRWDYKHTSSTGTAGGSGNYTWSIPSGYSIDTTKLPTGMGSEQTVGTAQAYETRNYSGNVVVNDAGTGLQIITGDHLGPQSLSSSSFLQFNVGTLYYSFEASVPIEGWKASASLSTTEINLRSTHLDAVDNSAEVLTADTTKIPFASYTDEFNVWDGDEFTPPKAGRYLFTGMFRCSTNAQRSSYIKTASQTKYVGRADASTSIHTFVGTIDLAAGETAYMISDASCTLSTGIPSQNHISITALPDLTFFSVTGEADKVSSTSTFSTYSITVNTNGNLTSFTPPAGEWDFTAQAVFFANGGATSATRARISITKTSSGEGTQGDSLMYSTLNQGNGEMTPVNISTPVNMTVNGSESVYLTSQVETAINNLEVAYKIFGRKIK